MFIDCYMNIHENVTINSQIRISLKYSLYFLFNI